jgi:uncharacterized repeat protein (TIGR04042 family)
MPEVLFTIQLPDGITKECYSPSTVVLNHFRQGEELSVGEFLARSKEAFAAAGERVRARFGFACSSAAAQLAEIERWACAYPSDAIYHSHPSHLKPKSRDMEIVLVDD